MTWLTTLMTIIIILRLHLSVCVCVYEREVTGSHSTRDKEVFFFSASVDMDIATDSLLTRLYIAMAPAVTKVSCFKGRRGNIRLKCTLTVWFWYMRWPGERKRATFWMVLSRKRRFYSKRLFLGALASEPAGLPTYYILKTIIRI